MQNNCCSCPVCGVCIWMCVLEEVKGSKWVPCVQSWVMRTEQPSHWRVDLSSLGRWIQLVPSNGTHQKPLSSIPNPHPPSFIWEYDLYFLKWRVLNPAIKELRGLPWVCHSNESMAGIWGPFNREKLVFTMLQTGIWRNLSGGEERASLEKKALRSQGLFIAVVFLPLIKECWSALWNSPREREEKECVWNKIKNAP